jgi:hypothetical protein
MSDKTPRKQKLYAYVDETGQDTEGHFFLVSVLVVGKTRDRLADKLREIEKVSRKRNAKWHKARPEYRMAYLEAVAGLRELKGRLFFEAFSDPRKYVELSSFTAAKAILRRAGEDYKVSVFVDGFSARERELFSRGLRELRIKTRKIRSVKKEENDEFIRLVDAVCGAVRDALEGQAWAGDMVEKLKGKKILMEL